MTLYTSYRLGNNRAAHRSVLNASPSVAGHGSTSVIVSWLYASLFVIATIGYPLAGALTTLYAQETQTISFGYRGLVVAMSVLLFLIAMFKGRLVPLSMMILVFFIAGLARLYYDNFIAFVPDADIAGLYFIGTVLAPAFALGTCCYYFDERKLTIMVFGYNSLACLFITYIYLSGAAGDADLSEKIDGRLFYAALNGTLIAYAGLFAVLSGYLLWQGSSVIFKITIALTTVMSLILMTLAASRGPWVAFILCIAYIAILRRNKYLAISMILGAFSLAFLFSDGAFETLKVFERFSTTGSDQSSSERLFAIRSALDGMLEYPLWGIAYVDPISRFYPHNLVVESGMALGVGGAALMLLIQFRLLSASLAFGDSGNMMLGIFVITVLTGAYLSGSIWQSSDFWCVAALSLRLLSTSRNNRLVNKHRKYSSTKKIGHSST